MARAFLPVFRAALLLAGLAAVHPVAAAVVPSATATEGPPAPSRSSRVRRRIRRREAASRTGSASGRPNRWSAIPTTFRCFRTQDRSARCARAPAAGAPMLAARRLARHDRPFPSPGAPWPPCPVCRRPTSRNPTHCPSSPTTARRFRVAQPSPGTSRSTRRGHDARFRGACPAPVHNAPRAGAGAGDDRRWFASGHS